MAIVCNYHRVQVVMQILCDIGIHYDLQGIIVGYLASHSNTVNEQSTRLSISFPFGTRKHTNSSAVSRGDWVEEWGLPELLDLFG
jgi:hypothetical protein